MNIFKLFKFKFRQQTENGTKIANSYREYFIYLNWNFCYHPRHIIHNPLCGWRRIGIESNILYSSETSDSELYSHRIIEEFLILIIIYFPEQHHRLLRFLSFFLSLLIFNSNEGLIEILLLIDCNDIYILQLQLVQRRMSNKCIQHSGPGGT